MFAVGQVNMLKIQAFSAIDQLAASPLRSEKTAAKPYEVSTFVRNVSRVLGQKMHFALSALSGPAVDLREILFVEAAGAAFAAAV